MTETRIHTFTKPAPGSGFGDEEGRYLPLMLWQLCTQLSMCSVSRHGSLVLSQLCGWMFMGRGIQLSAVGVLRFSDQVLKFRRKLLNNNDVFPCCKEEWFGVTRRLVCWPLPLNTEFGKNVRAGFSVCSSKVQLTFTITIALKAVSKPWLAGRVLFTVVFVACGLLLGYLLPQGRSR